MTDVLTAIDDALETGLAAHHDPELREIQELGLLLRADAPEPTVEYCEWLDERVENGFPKKPAPGRGALEALGARAGRAGGRWSRRRCSCFPSGWVRCRVDRRMRAVAAEAERPSPAAAAGPLPPRAAKAVARRPTRRSSTRAWERRSGSSADRALARSSPGVALPPSGRGFAPGRSDRKIERSIALELEMPLDKMSRVAEQVTAVTNRHGGFVLSSSVSTGDDSAGGDFDLRIPATRLRPALRDLAALADVRTQSQTGRDVTREHVTAKDRLRAARAERRSLLRRLEVATTDEEAEAIRRRLDLVAGEINGLRGQLRNLRLRTDYAVVTVSLLPKDGNEGGAGGGSFDDAIGDAGDILVTVAGVIVRVLAVALPLGLLALVGWLGARVVRRRQRESALA